MCSACYLLIVTVILGFMGVARTSNNTERHSVMGIIVLSSVGVVFIVGAITRRIMIRLRW